MGIKRMEMMMMVSVEMGRQLGNLFDKDIDWLVGWYDRKQKKEQCELNDTIRYDLM